MQKTYWTPKRLSEMNEIVQKIKSSKTKTNAYTLEEFIKKAKTS